MRGLSRELKRRGAFAWGDALEIMRQLAHALGAAHAREIVHRDLKPANIFLARSKHVGIQLMVKVLDFGIAKAMAMAGEATGVALGTPAWMAPEQTTADEDVGPPADVWALGLLSFMLLTGKHFFGSANAKSAPTAAVLREVVLDPIIPPSERAAQVGCADRLPEGFDSWFAHCVARDPKRRFPDATSAYAAFANLPAPRPLVPIPAVTASSPIPLSESATSSLRIDTPVTAIETPHPSRVSQLSRKMGGPSTNSAAMVTASSPTVVPGWRRATLALAALLALAAVAIVLVLLRGREPRASAIASAGGAPVAIAPIVRLHGSNTIGAELGPALAEAFLAHRTGAKTVVRRRVAPDEVSVEAREGDRVLESIEVFAHGSSTGFADLEAGRCDIGMSSRRIHDDERQKLAPLGDLASAASEHVIALDGIALIVNPANPVSVLTKAQIADIFSGKVRDWSKVGGSAGPIALYARDDRSGTYDTFKNLVLAGGSLASDAKRFEASEELSDAVAGDAAGIGFIGLPYVRSAKAVVVQDASSVPLLPSPMSVSTEDYALARRLYLYAPLGAPPAAKDFVDFALSEEGQKAAQAAGFVDLRPECDSNAARCTSCTREYREIVHGACRLSIDFRFDTKNSQLDTRGLRDLQRVMTLMGRPENAGRSILLLGFSDSKGSRADTVSASQERSGIVATQLRARGLHVDVVRGFGSDMPVADDAAEDGPRRNRRVEVWLR